MIGGQSRSHIARLNADGSADMLFNPGASDTVSALALQPDGRIIVGGSFTTIAGNARSRLARINADGTLDPQFSPVASSFIDSISLQLDGKIVVSGYFTQISAVPRNRIARINVDGSVDLSFDPNANARIMALAMQADGKLVAGGAFTAIGAQTRNFIARFGPAQPALQSLQIVGYSSGGSVVTWRRSGSGQELALPAQLNFSLAGSTFAPIGSMQHLSDGWRYVGFVPPLSSTFYLRASGRPSSGINNGSTGLIDSTRQFKLDGNDGIFFNGFD